MMIGRKLGTESGLRGTALVAMLLCFVGMGAISMALLSVSLGNSQEQRSEKREMRSSYVCLAGLSQAMYQMQRGLPGTVGTQQNPVSWGGAQCWVEAVQVTPSITTLRANGVENGIGSAQELTVREVPNTIWQYGAFGREFLHMDSNARIDSYDSGTSYASQAVNGSGNGLHARENGDSGSNGPVHMDVNGTIWGDAIAGPGHSTTILGNAVVTGTTTPATALVTLPTINVPSYPSSGALVVTGTQTLPSGNYNFSNLRVNSSKSLTITGPANVVCTNLELRSNSELIVNTTGGIVTFYVIDDFIMNSNSQFRSHDSVPANLRVNLLSDNVINPEINVQLDEIAFDSNTQLHGCVLAPNAHVEIDSNFQLFGSLMARSVDLDSNARFHFDEALLESTANGVPTYETIAWREVAYTAGSNHGSGSGVFEGAP